MLQMALIAANNLDWQYSKTSICERFKTLHHLSKWTDCTFIVGFDEHYKVINCHKLVLAASSPVFEALFFGLLATSESNRPIRVPDIAPHTFHLMLQYLYEDNVRFANVQEAGCVLYAAKKYLLPHLSSLCVKYLEQNLRTNTLWDILCVAENLNEETLLSSCIKVMCKYSKDVWWDDSEHMSIGTLRRFINEPLIDTCEKKLLEIILSWSENECHLQNVPATPANIRAVIDKFNLLSKIRLLTLSSVELEEVLNKVNIFRDEEVKLIKEHIEQQESLGNTPEISEKAQSLVSLLPWDFCPVIEKRRTYVFSSKKCARAVLSRKNTWTYGGSMFSVVSSSSKTLVTGFEVYTRLASQIDFVINRGQPNTYKEQLVLCIKNEADEEINQTKYENIVEYNSSQIINLSKPVCFQPKIKYTVKIELPSGQYPLNSLSKSAFTKLTHFSFSDCARYRDRYFGDHEVRDAGFVSGILHSI
ncbi:unnamed protein product [Bemisia tabaci]|uniref:BTB domain-containing protein n=1 Tax=Bemisia tabaci TaxID=7038 RepID=A0A9P0G4U9_BEMTA|nr:unnamed protein product [Bemisia tabaci]